MIQIPAAQIEFNEGGNTIWVHSPLGGTILRIKTMGKITVNAECENICSHSDMIVKEDIHVCLSEDAKKLTDLDRLRETFDAIGAPYEETITPQGYHKIYLSNDRVLFEFYPDGSVASTP